MNTILFDLDGTLIDSSEGIIKCVLYIGNILAEAFPYHATDDKNELPDDIVFGKL